MSFDTKQDANWSRERPFSRALSWPFPDSVGTAEGGVRRSWRFFTDRLSLLPLCGRGKSIWNSSRSSQEGRKPAESPSDSEFICLFWKKKKNPPLEQIGKTTAESQSILEQPKTTFRDVHHSQYHPPGYMSRIKLHFCKWTLAVLMFSKHCNPGIKWNIKCVVSFLGVTEKYLDKQGFSFFTSAECWTSCCINYFGKRSTVWNVWSAASLLG